MNSCRTFWLSIACCGLLAGAATAGDRENLAVDASFESALPPWFAERAGASYYAGKEQVAGAVDGRMVLAIEGWDGKGSKILSPPIELADEAAAKGVLSATVSARSFGKPDRAFLELALYDAKGLKKLASFGQRPLDGTGAWATIAQRGVKLAQPAKSVRLALVVGGPQAGARVEVDCVGLFAGDRLGAVADNNDLAVLEAEELADGKAWKAVEHYGGWYRGTPSGMKMLAGFERVAPGENRPAVKTLAVGRPGRHKLWVRFQTNDYAGKFTVAVRQAAKTVLEQTVVAGDAKYPRWAWSWDGFDVDLEAGPAELMLSRPATAASGHARKIDMLVLTNRLDYTPDVEHFRPQGYLRFTNLADGLEPFCLYIFVRRHQGPAWYANPGILSRAGLSGSYYVPADQSKWLAPGQTSPWVRISDYLLAAGGRNNVQITATRKMHTDGFVDGRVKGRLEFAVGPQRAVVKTMDVDQQAPRILMTLPYDFQTEADQIKTAYDYIRQTESEIERLGPAKGKPARFLNLAANLSLRSGVDDPEVLRREIGILKSLGFNQTYHLIAPPERAVAFCQENGLLPRFGGGPALWGAIQDKSQHHPDSQAMDAKAAQFAAGHQPILDRFIRSKLMDEPGGMSYESIVRSEPCRQKFAAWLKTKGLTPADLGVKSWDEVAPVTPEESDRRKELFYYTGLFRLEAFATLARACVAAKKKHLPGAMLTYVNYSPPNSGGSWTERGTDLFLAHRHGGMEMIWTEDWLGYSAGPEHLSDILALCRAAGRPDRCRLGAYCVGQGTPTIMRLKYYTLVAGGVRDIECYSYGPWYAGIDSWGRRFDLYRAIRDCNFELGNIDAHLEGTTRRKTDAAIFYNRTAAIWAKDNNSCEKNASFTHWALAHAGYDADFLAEEDVAEGLLAKYKVLYLDGPQLRRQTAEAVAKWVRMGGVLCATAGAGSRDEFDRPMDLLDDVLGAKSVNFAVKGAVSRPKHELRALKPLDQLAPVPATDAPAVSVAQFCCHETLEPLRDAKIILRGKDGLPAGVMHRAGQGTAIRVAALPGVSYVHEALQPPYDPDGYLPKSFRPELRDFIAWPARLAGAARVAAAQSPIAEIVRYDGPDRAVVFIIDHNAEPTARFTFDLFDAADFSRAIAASGKRVELLRQPDGALRVSLPLDAADAVVLFRGSH